MKHVVQFSGGKDRFKREDNGKRLAISLWDK